MNKTKQKTRTKKTQIISPYINLALIILLVFFKPQFNQSLDPFMIISLLCIAMYSSYMLADGTKVRTSALSWFISAYLFVILALSVAIKIVDAQHIAFASAPLTPPILLLPLVGLVSFAAILLSIKRRK